MKSRGYVAAALVAAFVLALAAPAARAQSGVGVWNVPPMFSDIHIGLSGDFIEVNVTVYEQNGGTDLFSVNIAVLDGNGVTVVDASYFQHDSNSSYDINDRFVDNEGGRLSAQRCVVNRYVVDFLVNNTVTQIILVFSQFQGKTIRVTATDNPGDIAFHEGPFSSEYRPPALITEEYQVYALVAASLMAAAVVAGFLFFRRGNSNKLARKIEKIESQHAED
jgi:hypothetical protein